MTDSFADLDRIRLDLIAYLSEQLAFQLDHNYSDESFLVHDEEIERIREAFFHLLQSGRQPPPILEFVMNRWSRVTEEASDDREAQ